MLSARGRYAFKYVTRDGEPVAIMERDPWAGLWCYGLKTEWKGKYGEPTYRPPFTNTYRQSVKAALKVIERALP